MTIHESATADEPRGMPSDTGWLASYRPVLDRALFGIALLGILVTVHLLIQQGRGFDRGCFGFTASEAVQASFDCELVVRSDAGTLLGVSNGVWGLLFYIGVVGLSIGAAYTRRGSRRWLKGSRAGLIAVGFAYSVYLGYVQYIVLDQWCALCLISAALATILFILVASDVLTKTTADMAVAPSSREPVHMGIALLLVGVLAGADVAYFNQLDGTSAPPATSASGEAVTLDDPDCYFDPARTEVADYMGLIQPYDATVGNAGAPVTIIEFLDPNCPHCASNHEVMKEVLEEHGQQVYYVYKPLVVIGHPSIIQVAALYLADDEGFFEPMLEEQFERQQPGGLSVDELREIAEEIGMDTENFQDRVQNDEYLAWMQREREVALDEVGLESVPTILVNGRFVPGNARNADCIGQLVQKAATS